MVVGVRCEHHEDPDRCIECATLVERMRVLTLLDDWMEQPGGIVVLRRAIERGTLMLEPEEPE